MPRPRLFHISAQDLGDWVLFEPHVSMHVAVGEERETPRISVCECIDACMRAITGLHCAQSMYVYRLHGQAKGLDADTPRKQVPDWDLHNEAWLLEPNTFRLVGMIETAYKVTDDTYPWWRWAKLIAKSGVWRAPRGPEKEWRMPLEGLPEEDVNEVEGLHPDINPLFTLSDD